ncbi:TVP38/TMEM64 family protein [Aureliella helgolandensis]|uniref:TVP38/TMEM64 family membrane protein n=1 Tax=Aureliella helgolandensis TaxID=2527968 RepID=A0A518G479_9BACT|nr:TVP38/TMEM64 family protein [Aureliella helgolandensis]QDV23397.1 TVP38/TMEM64 family inner membrane protein YdjZ [Aureliella helgolandensis]
MVDETQHSHGLQQSSGWLKKPLLLAAVAGVGGSLYWLLRDVLSLEYLASQETQMRVWQVDFPVITAIVALAVYVAVAGLSLPGASVLTLVCGWYFGFWEGLLVVSIGSTGGAMVAFLISRYLLRDWIQHRMQERLSRIDEVFEREGAFYLFTLRLVPAVPFFVINAVMGLTKVRAATFWWVSQLGMLPGTAAYVYAGSTVPSLQSLADNGVGGILSWQMLLAFAILGILPLAIKKAVTLLQAYPCTCCAEDLDAERAADAQLLSEAGSPGTPSL